MLKSKDLLFLQRENINLKRTLSRLNLILAQFELFNTMSYKMNYVESPIAIRIYFPFRRSYRMLTCLLTNKRIAAMIAAGIVISFLYGVII